MTNEFDFNVKHEDYEEWFRQIEKTSYDDCTLPSEPDPYAKCVRSTKIQRIKTV